LRAKALIGLMVTCSLMALSSCGGGLEREAAAMTGGDPTRGKAAIGRYGGGSCHTIPGVRGAHGLVGPPLAGVASRAYIAGVMQNTPDNLIQWLLDPPQVDQQTAMPKLGVTDTEARDMASYLYTLRQ
jgi:cytochrome c2